MRALIWVAVSSQIQAGDDKVSLVQQEKEAREYCEARGWQIIGVLRVPGHSRSNPDLVQALTDFRKAGVTAYDELQQHWKKRSADVLIAYTHDRLGRSLTQHAYIVENTISAGMTIELLYGGSINESNLQFQAAVGGMIANSGVAALKRGKTIGTEKLLERGLVACRPPMSHKVIRNEIGKAERLVVNEDLRPLWNDLAELILSGIGWQKIADALTALGYRNPKGNPFNGSYFHRVVLNPIFWGHTAMYHTLRGTRTKGRTPANMGPWVYDEHVDPPTGFVVKRNRCPAVWTGELGAAIKAELDRRHNLKGGTTLAHGKYRFAGIVVCGHCGFAMITYTPRRNGKQEVQQRKLRCPQKRYGKCDNGNHVRYRTVQTYLDALLTRMLELNSIEPLYPQVEPVIDHRPQLQAELTRLEQRLRQMIREQSTAPDAAQDYYREEVQQVSEQITIVKGRLIVLAGEQQRTSQSIERKTTTLAELQKLQLEAFWAQEDRVINQMLLRLFGEMRLVGDGGKIVGLTRGLFKRRVVD